MHYSEAFIAAAILSNTVYSEALDTFRAHHVDCNQPRGDRNGLGHPE